ncbi:hypothetical protein SVAN01_09331 [Stagonosporopsis vannaccii]|nr:hypothetical protein SVAN01_09331 [Stagonosporopsis vannaccii]
MISIASKVLSVAAALKVNRATVCSASSIPNYVAAVSTLFFISNVALFACTTHVARPRRPSVIYGRVTPQYVIASGPFTSVRYLTYIAYALGWVGAVVGVVTTGKLLQAFILVFLIASLFWLYRKGPY